MLGIAPTMTVKAPPSRATIQCSLDHRRSRCTPVDRCTTVFSAIRPLRRSDCTPSALPVGGEVSFDVSLESLLLEDESPQDAVPSFARAFGVIFAGHGPFP